MLGGYFENGPLERAVPSEPFINHYTECVLVAGRTWLALELLGRHVGHGTRHFLCALGYRTLGNQDEAKIAEQDLAVTAKQHVLRLDIPMYQLLPVSKL